MQHFSILCHGSKAAKCKKMDYWQQLQGIINDIISIITAQTDTWQLHTETLWFQKTYNRRWGLRHQWRDVHHHQGQAWNPAHYSTVQVQTRAEQHLYYTLNDLIMEGSSLRVQTNAATFAALYHKKLLNCWESSYAYLCNPQSSACTASICEASIENSDSE